MRERGGDREKKGSTKKDINDEQEIEWGMGREVSYYL